MLTVKRLRCVYGEGPAAKVAIERVGFEVTEGEFVSIVGPSGCGKTTLLRTIAGLQPPTDGEVLLLGASVTGVPDELALVFQDYGRSLLPWKTVKDNVEFALGKRDISRAEKLERTHQSLFAVGLGDYTEYYPWQLSGGMQQRVAIARALAYRPQIMLMDEPFASVDAQTREGLEDLTLSVREDFDMTVLFVTHDIDESVYLSDRVLVLSSSPATVLAEVPVDLPTPRDQIETRETDRFVETRSRVARLIREATNQTAAHIEPVSGEL